MMTRTDSQDESQVQADRLSLGNVFRIAKKHGRNIARIMVAIGAAYVLAAIALFLLLPSQRMTRLGFRLEFRGAERGQYPNGTKFASTEIISAPILTKVYRQDGLDRYVRYADFRSAIFVMQSNEDLEALTREYKAKLSDPRLTSVEREPIEREFQEKKAALSQADYTISLVTQDRGRVIPSALRPKILNDILSTWADVTVNDKGVSLYDISILSSGIFEREQLASYDYLIGLDLIRSKIQRVVSNIDDLLELPGAKVIRTRSGHSLAEIRVRLVDTLDFRLRPLIGIVLSKGISKDPNASIEFLKTQLKFNQLETQEANARVNAVRDALETYVQERSQKQESTKVGAPASTVIPQIDESFLNRIVEMTGEADDLAYRQKLVDDLRERAMIVVPLEAEARYYQTMLDSFHGDLRPATRSESEMIEAQVNAIVSDAIRNTKDVNEVYTALSKDLNPSTILYSATDPASTDSQRPLGAVTLFLIGVLLMAISLPAVTIAMVLYENAKAENKREDDANEIARASAITASANTPA